MTRIFPKSFFKIPMETTCQISLNKIFWCTCGTGKDLLCTGSEHLFRLNRTGRVLKSHKVPSKIYLCLRTNNISSFLCVTLRFSVFSASSSIKLLLAVCVCVCALCFVLSGVSLVLNRKARIQFLFNCLVRDVIIILISSQSTTLV